MNFYHLKKLVDMMFVPNGSGGVKQVKLHSNEDKDYSGIEISI